MTTIVTIRKWRQRTARPSEVKDIDMRTPATFNDVQLDLLRHMLGINTPCDRVPKPNRNYAAVQPGDPVYVDLAAIGAVEKMGRQFELDYYQCTAIGKAAAMASHRSIRLTKSKRVYSTFLDVKDAFDRLTFREFLTSPRFTQSRKEA